ncbi:MAG: Bax inhibitor-1/YccA family protein [Bacteroidota bacterium]|nr:Bax inhibitor-1/YccA family protein [Bacteroidota bacterium]
MEIRESDYKVTNERNSGLTATRSLFSSVFMWMGISLAITAGISYLFGTDISKMSLIMTITERGASLTPLGWIATLAPFGFVLLMGFGFQRLSSSALAMLLVVFSILMGMSLSTIFLAYTAASIFQTFLITAGMFGFMAVLGYTTNIDLTKFGSIMMMAFFGLFIAMLVNMFMHNEIMDFVISIIGVLVFTGLTAYDVQKIKNMGEQNMDTEISKKVSIMAALTLYLDFINLFLFLLRLFGGRRD